MGDATEGPNNERRGNCMKHPGTDPPHPRPPFGRHRSRAENKPAWLESVLRHSRGAESSARHRQMAAAQVTLHHLEAMGTVRLYRELRKRGVTVREAWNTSKSAHGPWRLSKTPALSLALPARIFSSLDLPALAG